jgi:hypothetical protein
MLVPPPVVALHCFINRPVKERIYAFADGCGVFLHLLFFALRRSHFELIVVALDILSGCPLLRFRYCHINAPF